MYFWYRFFTYLFYPFAPIYLYFRKIRKKEDPIRYKEKLSKINIPIHSITTETSSLEDVFLDLTGKSINE